MNNKYRELYSENNFILLVIANLISAVGSKLTLIALPVYAYQITGTVESISYMFVFETLPWVIFGPFMGSFLDGVNRKKAIIVLNLLAAIVMTMYFYASISGLYMLSFISGCISSALTSVNGAAMPMLVKKDKFKLAFSFYNMLITVVSLVIPGVGGLMMTIMPANHIFLIDAVSFFAAGIVILFVSIPLFEKENIKDKFLIKSVILQFRALLGNIYISVPLFLELVKTIAEAITFPLLIILILEVFSYPKNHYGFVISAMGVGNLIGSFIVGKYCTGDRSLKYILIGAIIYFSSYVLLTYNVSVIYLLCVVLAGNVGNGIRTIEIHGAFGTETEHKTRGTIIGIINCLISFCYVIGYLSAICASKKFGVKNVFYLSALISVLIYIITFLLLKNRFRGKHETA
jgi:MFS family permease